MKKLIVPFFRQESEYSCGPAALRMMLAYYNILKTEEELVEKSRTSFEGTCNEVLAETASHFRMCIVQTDLSMKTLFRCVESSTPMMVNYINPTSEVGHFAVVVGYSDTHLVLNDPSNGENYEIEHSHFEERWRSGDGKHDRWGLVFE